MALGVQSIDLVDVPDERLTHECKRIEVGNEMEGIGN